MDVIDIIDRADQALAAQGRGACAASYWLDSGWYVSDREGSIVPVWLGDAHWTVFVPAQGGERPLDLWVQLRARARAG